MKIPWAANAEGTTPWEGVPLVMDGDLDAAFIHSPWLYYQRMLLSGINQAGGLYFYHKGVFEDRDYDPPYTGDRSIYTGSSGIHVGTFWEDSIQSSCFANVA